jgi:hypothetical protein
MTESNVVHGTSASTAVTPVEPPVDQKNVRRAAWAGLIGTAPWWPVAVYMTAMMAISFNAALKSPETVDRDLLTEEDAK